MSARSRKPSDDMPPRQVEILQHLADGLSLIEIADKMGRSHDSLKQESYRIREQLGADTNCQAVAMALRRRLIN